MRSQRRQLCISLYSLARLNISIGNCYGRATIVNFLIKELADIYGHTYKNHIDLCLSAISYSLYREVNKYHSCLDNVVE